MPVHLLTPGLSLVIPADVLDALGWTADTVVHPSVEHGALVLRALQLPGDAGLPAPRMAEPAPAPSPAPSPMSGRVVSSRIGIGVTRSQLALLLGVLPVDVTAWEEGRAAPDAPTLDRLDALEADPEAARTALESLE
ncbi:MAG: DNA-binding transcriptional regulator YiaG [Myxococcota bacterium]|jgi:DNA-binding transcriptional regulator YiaG